MVSANIDIMEVNKLLKNLKQLEPKMQKGILTLAVKAGAKTIEEQAKIYVPKRGGKNTLENAIITKKKSVRQKKRDGDKSTDAVYTVGINIDGKAFYASMVEFGTRHSQAEPFMRPAFENGADMALNGAKSYLKRRVEQAIRKGLIK